MPRGWLGAPVRWMRPQTAEMLQASEMALGAGARGCSEPEESGLLPRAGDGMRW